jgi:hypothetical protein
LKHKPKTTVKFYNQKWFKLTCLFAFFVWLWYITHTTLEINSDELITLKVTVNKEWESGGNRNPIRLYFATKEYPNQFGIYVGGIFGRWSAVTKTLVHNRKITIKIYKNNKNKLNKETEVIPIYYLYSDQSGLVFNEEDFNKGEKSSDNRFKIVLGIVFLLGLWKILTD